jgi:hypothetical protein
MTSQEAKDLAATRWWEHTTPQEAALFQLNEEMLCMPFSDFHKAVETLLDRPVFTHEFANPSALLAEAAGKCERPTLDQILTLIPEEKRVVVVTR